MILEIYSFESGFRVIDKYEYGTQTEIDKVLMLRKLGGTLVGYKIYDLSMDKFMTLTLEERNNLPWKGKFDKEAYVNKGATK